MVDRFAFNYRTGPAGVLSRLVSAGQSDCAGGERSKAIKKKVIANGIVERGVIGCFGETVPRGHVY